MDAFDLFDPEGTGKIGYHEVRGGGGDPRHGAAGRQLSGDDLTPAPAQLKTAIRALGFEAKKEEVMQHIQDQDVEGVGAIDKEQFVKISAMQLWRLQRRDGSPLRTLRPRNGAQ